MRPRNSAAFTEASIRHAYARVNRKWGAWPLHLGSRPSGDGAGSCPPSRPHECRDPAGSLRPGETRRRWPRPPSRAGPGPSARRRSPASGRRRGSGWGGGEDAEEVGRRSRGRSRRAARGRRRRPGRRRGGAQFSARLELAEHARDRLGSPMRNARTMRRRPRATDPRRLVPVELDDPQPDAIGRDATSRAGDRRTGPPPGGPGQGGDDLRGLRIDPTGGGGWKFSPIQSAPPGHRPGRRRRWSGRRP